MANADLSLRRPRHRALVAGGLGARRSGCSAGFGRRGLLDVRRSRARDLPRLDRRDVRAPSRPTACSRRGCCTRASAPSNAVSGFMTQVIACAVQLGGHARARSAAASGSSTRSRGSSATPAASCGRDADVERITVSAGRATGVVLTDGETVGRHARGRRRRDADAALRQPSPPGRRTGRRSRGSAARYRYGRAGMQIHLALDEPPRWKGPDAERLARTAIVHVTPGLDGVSRAVNEAERGLLPAEATIVAGQPCAVDPSRAPDGKWIVWIQLQELPAGRVKGDAAGRARRRRRDVDGGAPRGLRRPDRRAARRVDREPRVGHARAHRPLAGRPRGAQLRTSSAATSTPGPAPSTRTSSGARSPPPRATAPPSRACGTSARARTPGPASAPARATSSRRS